ncbi:MAG: two-component system alkaline phosphatase synthesis response regulator PhoP [Flavobacteriales bacterium]|jgi:two-component system alkaline phosphatase synthesis response regulator PhoP
MKKVLIIEDDQDISKLLQIHLKDMDFEVQAVYNGKEGLLEATNNNFDFIILDIMLPEMDGFEVCRQLRIEKNHTPILMLTSKSEEIDKVVGLETGADDYMTKPFSIRELEARVKAIMRRSVLATPSANDKTSRKIELDGLLIEPDSRTVKKNGERLSLTPKEFDLLVLLASNPGRTYSRMDLLNEVWNYDFEGYEHTVNSHINRLRGKVEDDINEPTYILTAWGVGYRFREF